MRYIISLVMASAASLPFAALAEVPKVVTDIPPVHSLVSLVMGDLGQPELLLEPGASEHHFQLRPSQARAVAGADLVVWVGPELTPWLERPLGLRPEGADTLGLLATDGTERQDYLGGDDDHDHDHGHDHNHDHGHDHGHSHDGVDPHAWLDPVNGLRWLQVISAELGRLDPTNAATYASNASRAAEAIAAAEDHARNRLAPLSQAHFATFHDAYGYYTGHFGLQPAASLSLGDASTPGAKRLSELRAKIEAGSIICLFPEAQHDPAQLTQLAEGTGARIGGALDPVGSMMEPGPALYPALISGMADTLADCLGK